MQYVIKRYPEFFVRGVQTQTDKKIWQRFFSPQLFYRGGPNIPGGGGGGPNAYSYRNLVIFQWGEGIPSGSALVTDEAMSTLSTDAKPKHSNNIMTDN